MLPVQFAYYKPTQKAVTFFVDETKKAKPKQ